MASAMVVHLAAKCEALGVSLLPCKIALLEGLATKDAMDSLSLSHQSQMTDCCAILDEFDPQMCHMLVRTASLSVLRAWPIRYRLMEFPYKSRHKFAICMAAARMSDLRVLKRLLPSLSQKRKVAVFELAICTPNAPLLPWQFSQMIVTNWYNCYEWITIAHPANCAQLMKIMKSDLLPRLSHLAEFAMINDPPRLDILQLTADYGHLLSMADVSHINGCRGHDDDLEMFWLATRMLKEGWLDLLRLLLITSWSGRTEPDYTIGKIITAHATAWQNVAIVKKATYAAIRRLEYESLAILSRLSVFKHDWLLDHLITIRHTVEEQICLRFLSIDLIPTALESLSQRNILHEQWLTMHGGPLSKNNTMMMLALLRLFPLDLALIVIEFVAAPVPISLLRLFRETMRKAAANLQKKTH